MISQIRIYTINKGEMDNFLKHFKDEIMVLHQKIGVPIVGTWVNRPQNEFIWVRTYKDKAGLDGGHWQRRRQLSRKVRQVGYPVPLDSTSSVFESPKQDPTLTHCARAFL